MKDALTRRIAVVGLGYVGLPVAVAMARRFPGTVGFDIDAGKVARLRTGQDTTGEVEAAALTASGLETTSDPEVLRAADFYVVAVPTPVDRSKHPNLGPIREATHTLGTVLKPGDIVVYESTVYPGVTEEVCGAILEQTSGLRCGDDFKLGYSPERINPGDHAHRFEKIVKVVSGQDAETLELVARVYGAVVDAGIYRASSIRVAEASKVIENVQRDLNIALMNELALIFDRLGIDTHEVLEAANTKWNFLPFHPGLVGGHCIGVDPYYLTAKAEEIGITPQVILAGRRINDSMGEFVAQQTIKQLILADSAVRCARVAVLGLTFKENVPDIRNSQVPRIVQELREYGVEVLVHDPVVQAQAARQECAIDLVEADLLTDLNAVVLAVPHQGLAELARILVTGRTPVLIDVRSVISREDLPSNIRYWRL
jgi:UDP-N-acetyl-D-galactosamine dehydrogenase